MAAHARRTHHRRTSLLDLALSLPVALLVALVGAWLSSTVVRLLAPGFPSSPSGSTVLEVTSKVVAAHVPGSTAHGSCSQAPAALSPGIERCLLYRFTNRGPRMMVVTSLTSHSTRFVPSTAPTTRRPSCHPQEVVIGVFSGRLLVLAHAQATVAVPIELQSTGTQVNCQGGTFAYATHFTAAPG